MSASCWARSLLDRHKQPVWCSCVSVEHERSCHVRLKVSDRWLPAWKPKTVGADSKDRFTPADCCAAPAPPAPIWSAMPAESSRNLLDVPKRQIDNPSKYTAYRPPATPIDSQQAVRRSPIPAGTDFTPSPPSREVCEKLTAVGPFKPRQRPHPRSQPADVNALLLCSSAARKPVT